MSAQLNYDYRTPKGVAGGLYDISFSKVETRTNEENDGVLKYGMAVAVGTVPGTNVKVPATGTTAEKIEGIAIKAANTEQDMKGKLNVVNNASISVLKKGSVWGRTAEGAAPTYKGKAYVVIDGEYAGCFTSNASAYTHHEKCESSTSGALKVIANTESVSGSQIKLENVVAATGYTPAVGDYVVSKQVHGATVDFGATFGNETDNGIAVINL